MRDSDQEGPCPLAIPHEQKNHYDTSYYSKSKRCLNKILACGFNIQIERREFRQLSIGKHRGHKAPAVIHWLVQEDTLAQLIEFVHGDVTFEVLGYSAEEFSGIGCCGQRVVDLSQQVDHQTVELMTAEPASNDRAVVVPFCIDLVLQDILVHFSVLCFLNMIITIKPQKSLCQLSIHFGLRSPSSPSLTQTETLILCLKNHSAVLRLFCFEDAKINILE